MIILGIDPGLQVAGFSLATLINGKTRLIESGILKLKPKDPLQKRVSKFHDFILAKIEQYKVTAIALETPFIGRNAQTFLKLGYLRGILYLLAEKNGIIIYEFTPSQVKQAVTGYGNAGKEQVQLMVKRLFPGVVDFATCDASDAVAVALCGLWQANSSFKNLR